MIEWKNIEFYVPHRKGSGQPKSNENEEKALLLNDKTGIPEPKIISKNGRCFKQVLQQNSGFVLPKEMIAIMGPSGSGKTSLLNVLSQRSSLSNGSFVKGQVCINDRQL